MVAGRRQHVGCRNKRTEPIRALHSLRFSSRDGMAAGCGWGLTAAAVQRRRVLALNVLVKPRPAEEEACREQRGTHQSDTHTAPPCGRRQRRSLTSQSTSAQRLTMETETRPPHRSVSQSDMQEDMARQNTHTHAHTHWPDWSPVHVLHSSTCRGSC